jgi:hypothetical protein
MPFDLWRGSQFGVHRDLSSLNFSNLCVVCSCQWKIHRGGKSFRFQLESGSCIPWWLGPVFKLHPSHIIYRNCPWQTWPWWGLRGHRRRRWRRRAQDQDDDWPAQKCPQRECHQSTSPHKLHRGRPMVDMNVDDGHRKNRHVTCSTSLGNACLLPAVAWKLWERQAASRHDHSVAPSLWDWCCMLGLWVAWAIAFRLVCVVC